MRLFSGEKGLWSVAEEAFSPEAAMGGEGFSGLWENSFCGGFA
jgi:hypothetical protein